jgi:hypothetical protein
VAAITSTNPVQRIMATETPIFYRKVHWNQASDVNNSDGSSSSNSPLYHYESLTLDDLESLKSLKDLTGASPSNVHLTPEGVIDWSQYDHIQLYHTRKAGGSILLMWAKRVALRHHLTFGHQEGTTFDPRD